MSPTVKRVLAAAGGLACMALTLTVFKEPSVTHDELVHASRELLGAALGGLLLGGGAITIHDHGHVTVFGVDFTIPGFDRPSKPPPA